MIQLNQDKVKEEPVDHEEEEPIINNDIIVASYNIVRLDPSNKIKTFALAGLSNVIGKDKHRSSSNISPSCNISIRTDSKELKITPKSQQNQRSSSMNIFTTKESQLNLRRISFAVKFSRETGKAYFLPINSMHTLSHLDEKNRDSNSVDSQNLIFQDCFKIPHPTRNKHDQLRIEMKSHLYKPLTRMNDPEMVRKFFEQLFTSMSARRYNSNVNDNGGQQQQSSRMLSTTIKTNTNRAQSSVMELINCPYWFLSKINICDINRIELVELKVEILLRKVQVIRFAEMIMLFHSNSLDHHSKLLNTLQSICYLINGNWVIKSHLLYKYDTIHDGDSRQLLMKRMIAAREYLLWHFAHQKPLKMIDIIDKFKKIADYEQILNRLTIRTGSMVEINFILEPDSSFITTYPMISKKHHDRSRDQLANKLNEHMAILNS
ncbi:DNA-directed RNA polymerase III subunit RPC5 [Dermatophagoides farinae]|uniref:DNA-directed RNA polymerase III subunit RPC5 n=1 Tax=Dermatophagoides farinae TaxID=6954 RepID=A0A922HHK1_DERFA|nr:DNA-directed RNA polymerase III subunit RPC5 [Dermatophagoides farinae]